MTEFDLIIVGGGPAGLSSNIIGAMTNGMVVGKRMVELSNKASKVVVKNLKE